MWFSQDLQCFLADSLRTNWKHKTIIFPVWFILLHVFLLPTVRRKRKWETEKKANAKRQSKNKENKLTKTTTKVKTKILREKNIYTNQFLKLILRKMWQNMKMTSKKAPFQEARLGHDVSQATWVTSFCWRVLFQKGSSSLRLQEGEVKEDTIVDNLVEKS